jgi:hypothetical protein
MQVRAFAEGALCGVYLRWLGLGPLFCVCFVCEEESVVGEGSGGDEFSTNVVVCNGLCGVVQVGNNVKEPTVGV